MTDPGADMKARAREGLLEKFGWDTTLEEEIGEVSDFVAAFAAKEVAEIMKNHHAHIEEATTREREACAKAVCRYCRDPKLWMPAAHHPELKRYMHHGIGVYRIADCQANLVHSRSQMKGEGL